MHAWCQLMTAMRPQILARQMEDSIKDGSTCRYSRLCMACGLFIMLHLDEVLGKAGVVRPSSAARALQPALLCRLLTQRAAHCQLRGLPGLFGVQVSNRLVRGSLTCSRAARRTHRS